jgi:nicotinamidase-related amidase
MNTSVTAVLAIDVQGDFTEAEKGSLAVAGTNQDFIDSIRRATAELRQAGFPVFAT